MKMKYYLMSFVIRELVGDAIRYRLYLLGRGIIRIDQRCVGNDIGHFEGDIWIVDKERIMQILTSETTTKNLNLCKHFQTDKIEKTVENLPDKIDVTEDGEWEYKYREALWGCNKPKL